MTMIKTFDDFVNEAVTPAILANAINDCKAQQLKNISDFKSKYKTELDKANKVVNIYQVIDKFSNWVVGKTPAMVQAALANSPGTADKLVIEAYTFVYMEIQNQLKSIGTLKKAAIKLLAPSAAEFDSQKIDSDLETQIFQLAENIFDVGFAIGYRFDSKSIEADNASSWSVSFVKSLNSRESLIIKNIKLLIRNFLYN
jgi:hypothetical protein